MFHMQRRMKTTARPRDARPSWRPNSFQNSFACEPTAEGPHCHSEDNRQRSLCFSSSRGSLPRGPLAVVTPEMSYGSTHCVRSLPAWLCRSRESPFWKVARNRRLDFHIPGRMSGKGRFETLPWLAVKSPTCGLAQVPPADLHAAGPGSSAVCSLFAR